MQFHDAAPAHSQLTISQQFVGVGVAQVEVLVDRGLVFRVCNVAESFLQQLNFLLWSQHTLCFLLFFHRPFMFVIWCSKHLMPYLSVRTPPMLLLSFFLATLQLTNYLSLDTLKNAPQGIKKTFRVI